jgi:diguanylate cyclase (GGDEF)-like protein
MEGKPYLVEDLTCPPASLKIPVDNLTGLSPAARSLLLIPLHFEGQVVGSLNFSSKQPAIYSVSTLSVARMVALHLSGKLGSLLAHYRTTTTLKNLLSDPAYYNDPRGLSRHEFFEKRLQQILTQARSGGQTVAVCLLELTRFDLITATFGYDIAAKLLRQITERLQACVYGSDLVIPLEGAEVGLVLTKLRDLVGLGQLAQKLLQTFDEPFQVEDREVVIAASLGISLAEPDSAPQVSARELVRRAAKALHCARTHGKNNYQLFTPALDEATSDRLLIESSLRRALEREELRLRYQPQIDLINGKLVGCETLLRWQHPELGWVSPAKFIPLAEETGTIIPIGSWVLQQACRQVRAWEQAGYGPLKVSVNVSALQFARPDFVEIVAHSLEESGLAAECLVLELTESLLFHDYQQNLETMHRLKEIGVAIAIDDFGTGYSALSYLQRLPLDILKIDQSFVRALGSPVVNPPGQGGEQAIVQAIITLAHNLGMQVVAEGVEIEAQREFLRQNGCDQMQGYLFSAPLEPGEFETLLKKAQMVAAGANVLASSDL